MLDIDFAKHNEEQAAVWKAYHEGKPVRVPMVLGVNPRYTMWREEVNPRRLVFKDYFENPDFMFEHQLAHQHWVAHNLIRDAETGIPENGWQVAADLQNSYEALWFGCRIRYWPNEVPDTVPVLTDDNKRALFDRGIPDPFDPGGWLGRAWEYRDYFIKRASGYEFHGKPVHVGGVPGVGTDGPLTVACNVRGATNVLTDMYADPDFYHELMSYIVEATIARIRAYRERLGEPVETKAWGFADDSIQLISLEAYKEFVYPYHKRLVDAFGCEGPNAIHLCGDVARHLKFLQEAMNIQAFDTGYPIDLGETRRLLGPGVTLSGGPSVAFLQTARRDEVDGDVKRILQSGVMEGGKFMLREANNLPPSVSPEKVTAMYEACKRYGRYEV
jgi:uroporphyrinogen-III decarboxylase